MHHSSPVSTFPEATPDLPIQDLRVWNEKLGLECTQIREIPPPHTVPSASLESEVSMDQPIPVSIDMAAAGIPWYTSSGLHKSAISRLIISLWNMLRPGNGLPPEVLPSTYRSSRSRRFRRRHEAIIPLTHVPILARTHNLYPRKLDDGIQPPKELCGIEPGACKSSSPIRADI